MLSKNKSNSCSKVSQSFSATLNTLTNKESTLRNSAEQMSLFDAMFTGLKQDKYRTNE